MLRRKSLVLIMFICCPFLCIGQNFSILEKKDSIAITKLDSLNTEYREANISLSPDGNNIFFMSTRCGMKWSTYGRTYKGEPRCDGDIYYSSRIGGVWQKAKPLTDIINDGEAQDEPLISIDGKNIYFQSWEKNWEYNGGPYYKANLNGSECSDPVGIGGGIHDFFQKQSEKYSKSATDGMCISPDGNSMLFAYAKDYEDKMDLYLSKMVNGVWSFPTKIIGNTDSNERSVFIATDGKTIFFASDAYQGFGGLDIYKTTLNNNGTFGQIINIGEPFNTSDDDFGFIISASGNEAYFIRNGDIYCAAFIQEEVILKPLPIVTISGILNTIEGKPLQTIIDLLFKDNLNIIISSASGENNNEFEFSIPENKGYYIISFQDEKYKKYNKEIYIDSTGKSQIIQVSINLFDPANKDTIVKTPIEDYSNYKLIIYFDFSQNDIKENYYTDLDKLVKILEENERFKVQIHGHTDALGSNTDNLVLGEKRALAVKDYLNKSGISSQRIITKSLGETNLLNGENKGTDAINRRCEIKLIR